MQRFFLFFFCSMMILNSSQISAQKIIKKVKETAKQTAEQKAEQKTAEGVNQGVDKGLEGVKSIFKKKHKKENGTNNEDEVIQDVNETETADTNVTNESQNFGVYTKFTFEPGNKILFYDDFEKDQLGDFPLQWETSGSGQVVNNSVYPGKWLSFSGRSGYMPSTGELPENYTVEFDLVTNGMEGNKSGNALTIGFLKKKSYALGNAGGHANLNISLHQSGSLTIGNSGAEKTPRINTKLSQRMKADQLVHFSIAVNKNRLRIWMDEEKLVDIPSLLVGNMGRYILFQAYEIHPDKGLHVLISNFKIAESKEDIRSQLLENGRFSTTGIYFKTNEATILKESFGILKTVADYLKQNPEVKIQVIGHTDAQGDDAFNQELSNKRANAVVSALITHFEIPASNLESAGMGEKSPVDDNSTELGRANNRRVEFVKM